GPRALGPARQDRATFGASGQKLGNVPVAVVVMPGGRHVSCSRLFGDACFPCPASRSDRRFGRDPHSRNGRGQHVANHRADGRATVRKHRLPGGTHRDSAVSAGAVKEGVLGVLATATIAAPLAAAASGLDEAAPQGETSAQAAPAAPAAEAQAPAPVALPSTDTAEAAVETRADDADADRSETRTSPVSDDAEAEEEASEDAEAEDETAEGTGIEVSVPEP